MSSFTDIIDYFINWQKYSDDLMSSFPLFHSPYISLNIVLLYLVVILILPRLTENHIYDLRPHMIFLNGIQFGIMFTGSIVIVWLTDYTRIQFTCKHFEPTYWLTIYIKYMAFIYYNFILISFLNAIVSILRHNTQFIWFKVLENIYILFYVFFCSTIFIRGYIIFLPFLHILTGSFRCIYLILRSPGSFFSPVFYPYKKFIIILSIIQSIAILLHLFIITYIVKCYVPTVYAISSIIFSLCKFLISIYIYQFNYSSSSSLTSISKSKLH